MSRIVHWNKKETCKQVCHLQSFISKVWYSSYLWSQCISIRTTIGKCHISWKGLWTCLKDSWVKREQEDYFHMVTWIEFVQDSPISYILHSHNYHNLCNLQPIRMPNTWWFPSMIGRIRYFQFTHILTETLYWQLWTCLSQSGSIV